MTNKQIIRAFIDAASDDYGKGLSSNITIARAVEILREVLETDETMTNPTTPAWIKEFNQEFTEGVFAFAEPTGEAYDIEDDIKEWITQNFIHKPHLAEVLEGMKKDSLQKGLSLAESTMREGFNQALTDLATTLGLEEHAKEH